MAHNLSAKAPWPKIIANLFPLGVYTSIETQSQKGPLCTVHPSSSSYSPPPFLPPHPSKYPPTAHNLDVKSNQLAQAYARCSSCGEIIENLTYFSEITGQDERTWDLWTKLYQTRRIAPGLFGYNYNMLQSTLPDAILFTDGDNDTFPALTLQRSMGIRPNVVVLNLHTIQRQRDLLARALKTREIAIETADLPKADAAFVADLPQRLTAAAPDVPLYFALSVSVAYFSASTISTMPARHNRRQTPQHPLRLPLYPPCRTTANKAAKTPGRTVWRERALGIAYPYPYLIKELENRAIK